MESMQALIERADAFMRHCVAGVTKGGKDKGAAFAICKAGGNKAGYYEPGTKNKTAKGRKAIRAHGRDAAAKGKDAAYERAIKGEDTMTKMQSLIRRLEEATGKVNVETNLYRFNHGAAPRGRGNWMFGIGTQDPDMRSDEAFAPGGNMLYAEAVKAAQAEARKRGVSTIYVLP
jgi:hypothetical protein